ncbi:MAG: hypothetical protein FWD57_00290 [Polyangiaceae bacterium]|nr:hypothetical protein [Polyangiaceae bacterium]
MRTTVSMMVLLSGVLAFGVSGCCGDIAEKLANKAAEKVVQEAVGDSTFAMGSDVDISDLPAAFRYPGAVAKQKVSGNGVTAYMLETTDPGPKVKAFYESVVGYKQTAKADLGNVLSVVYEDAAGEMFTVGVQTSAVPTTISLSRSSKK